MKNPPFTDSWKNLWSSMRACPSPFDTDFSWNRVIYQYNPSQYVWSLYRSIFLDADILIWFNCFLAAHAVFMYDFCNCCECLLSVFVVCCSVSNVAVHGCCWFLVVECWCCLLLVVVCCWWLSVVGGCLLLVVVCRWWLLVFIGGRPLYPLSKPSSAYKRFFTYWTSIWEMNKIKREKRCQRIAAFFLDDAIPLSFLSY